MSQQTSEYRHFSAAVDIELRADGRLFDVWSIGPSSIVLKEPQEIPAGEAEILLLVDGKLFKWKIRLPFGSVPFDEEIEIVPLGRLTLAT